MAVPRRLRSSGSGSLLRYTGLSLSALAGLFTLQLLLRLVAPLTEEEAARGSGFMGRVFGPPDALPADIAAAQLRAEAFLDSVTNEYRLVLFGESVDKQTHQTRMLLLQYMDEDKIHTVDLDLEPDGRAIHEALTIYTGGGSLPRLYIEGRFVGGPAELAAMDAGGDLERLLARRGFTDQENGEGGR